MQLIRTTVDHEIFLIRLKCCILSVDITLQKEIQEGTPPLTQSQEPLKPQENISRPIHHPLVLKTNFDEEEEEGDEQNG